MVAFLEDVKLLSYVNAWPRKYLRDKDPFYGYIGPKLIFKIRKKFEFLKSVKNLNSERLLEIWNWDFR